MRIFLNAFIVGFLMIVGAPRVNAQLFPGLEGADLVEALQGAFTPSQLLTESQVKDTLYAVIFHKHDSVHCIYSGMAHDVPEGVDPSQWIYENGTSVTSMNLEHGWPQSKGAGKSTDGNRNMHHLFPSRTAINSDRADFPFNEISDPNTQKWYYLDMVQGNIPANNIDAYSEFRKNVFEPREEVKGDIARAMMYFWTVYREDAEAADPGFFELQRETLCAWHDADPVDEEERGRSELIAGYQSGLENPFVVDCSLAKRAYCPENAACAVSTADTDDQVYQILVNPEQHTFTIACKEPVMVDVAVMSLVGQVVLQTAVEANDTVRYENLAPGVYLFQVLIGNEQFVKKVFLY